MTGNPSYEELFHVFPRLLVLDVDACALDPPCQEDAVGLGQRPGVFPDMVADAVPHGGQVTPRLRAGELPLRAGGGLLAAGKIDHRDTATDDEVRQRQDADVVVVIPADGVGAAHLRQRVVMHGRALRALDEDVIGVGVVPELAERLPVPAVQVEIVVPARPVHGTERVPRPPRHGVG